MNAHQEADQFLKDLINEADSIIEPDESKDWADAFLSRIRSFREKDGFMHSREAERAADRLGKQAAADPYRFFWEFWQNADDAKATEICFSINNDHLIITNDGHPFSAREIYSLIFVASTTKADQPNLMGQFGVGSLSLTRFSESPTYSSGYYSFKLERSFTYPVSVREADQEYFDGTKVIAPLKTEINPNDLYKELSEKIEGDTLLYMKHLERIIVRNQITGEETTASIHVRSLNSGDYVIVGDQEWLRYTSDVLPPSGMKRDDGTEVIDAVTITLVRQTGEISSHPVCAYFPTQQFHWYPWRFSAPFDITAGRENLLPSKFNRWLLREIGRTMVQAAISDDVGLPLKPWDIVPLEGHQDELINLVWEGARDEMKSLAWLPTKAGLARPVEIVFPETTEVEKLITNKDLISIGENRQWLIGIPSEKAKPVLQALGALRTCCHVLSRVLEQGPKKRKSEWYLRILDQIIRLNEDLGGDDISERLLSGKCFLNRNGQPTSLIRAGQSGRIVCNTRSEILSKELGGLFKNNILMILHKEYRLPDRRTADEKDEMRYRVNEWLRSESSEDTFQYETRFDAAAFIKTCIVDNNSFSNTEENSDRLLNFVRNHLEAYISDRGPGRREETLAELGKSMLIKSHVIGENGKNETTFRSISVVYIPSGFLDKPSWSTAARGIPGFYWIDWRYRKSLVRTGNPMSVVAFLKALGAATGPRVERIESNSWHNVYNFTRVSHGDPERCPNFPHSSVGFGEYTDYGLVGDYKSNDLDRWLSFTEEQNHIERSKRGEALLRTLEEQWENYTRKTLATANGYYFNGKYEIGRVPTRWVWSLQNSEWARSVIGEFTKPKNIQANTEESRTLLSNHGDKMCNWNANNLEVAKELGFQTIIPPSMIISDLQEMRRNELMPNIETANAYYGYLSSCDLSSLILSIAIAFEEGLLFAPGSIQSWWRPEECLRENYRDTFGDYCGYLHKYNNANVLWDQLNIQPGPDLKFIERLLKRVSENSYQERRDFNTLLERTYLYAEKLLEESLPTNPNVPIYASGGWRSSSYVFTTDYDELAARLEKEGLWRWDFDLYDLVPNFQKWTGIINIGREAQLKVGSIDYIPDPRLEDKLHAGVQGFGIEVSRINRELWPVIRNRIQDIIAGKVQRVNHLQLEAKVPIPNREDVVCNVKVPAFYQDGNVFISKLTELSDSCVATALLSGLPLSGRDRWSYIKALTLQLSDPNTEIDISIDLFGDGTQPEDYSELFDKPEEETAPTEIKPDPSKKNAKKKPPVTPPYPVDEYEIEKDEGGEEPATSEGGLTKRKDVKVRPPRRNRGGGGSGGGNGGGHSTKSTEQRAVEIYRKHVLDPENIQISDQRVIRGVGADIVGDDNIFRELKSRTGSADDEIILTGHEYARAEQARDSYELVIVEYVWDEPVITIIRNPLNRLTYYPVGDVGVAGWKNLDPKPRIISLKKRGKDYGS